MGSIPPAHFAPLPRSAEKCHVKLSCPESSEETICGVRNNANLRGGAKRSSNASEVPFHAGKPNKTSDPGRDAWQSKAG
jgi:hypothetical protein